MSEIAKRMNELDRAIRELDSAANRAKDAEAAYREAQATKRNAEGGVCFAMAALRIALKIPASRVASVATPQRTAWHYVELEDGRYSDSEVRDAISYLRQRASEELADV